MAIVAKKPSTHPTATNRKSFLSMTTLDEYSGNEYSNSDVTKSIRAMAARNKLMSEIDNGKFIFSPRQQPVQDLQAKTI